MRTDPETIHKNIYIGAMCGLVAWTVYAVIECWFSSILPSLVLPKSIFHVRHWGFTVLLFVLYAIFGLGIGGLAGVSLHIAAGRIPGLARAPSTLVLRAVATSTVVFIFVAIFTVAAIFVFVSIVK